MALKFLGNTKLATEKQPLIFGGRALREEVSGGGSGAGKALGRPEAGGLQFPCPRSSGHNVVLVKRLFSEKSFGGLALTGCALFLEGSRGQKVAPRGTCVANLLAVPSSGFSALVFSSSFSLACSGGYWWSSEKQLSLDFKEFPGSSLDTTGPLLLFTLLS